MKLLRATSARMYAQRVAVLAIRPIEGVKRKSRAELDEVNTTANQLELRARRVGRRDGRATTQRSAIRCSINVARVAPQLTQAKSGGASPSGAEC